MTTERIDPKKLERACRKQEKKNLREKSESLTWVTMLNYVYKYIVETGEGFVIMRNGWKEYIKTL